MYPFPFTRKERLPEILRCDILLSPIAQHWVTVTILDTRAVRILENKMIIVALDIQFIFFSQGWAKGHPK